MKKPFVYFDILDTARTVYPVTSNEVLRVKECLQLGQAELKLSVLCGRTPVFPQTYGWDSTALLSYTEEPEGSFRWLVKNGFIRIRLRNATSISEAALAAFQNPAYRQLAAWPEFNTDDPLDARRPLVEAMQTGRTSSLPNKVRERLELLYELSDAAKSAPPVDNELPRGNKFCAAIAKVASVANVASPGIGNILQQCTLLPDPNNRTAIGVFLDEEEKRDAAHIPQVREIVNACFNLVAADCVGAADVGLTIPPSQDALSMEILRQTFQSSERADLFQGGSDVLNSDDLADLTAVSWENVRHFVDDKSELSQRELYREAQAAKFISNVAVEQTPRYALKTSSTNFVLLAGMAAAGVLTTDLATDFGVPGAILGTAITVGLAGVGGIDFRAKKKKELTKSLEKKWQGLLHSR